MQKLVKILLSALNLFTRVQHDGFSHYNASLGHLNTIDHIFISSPGWAQLPWRLSAEVGRPEVVFDKGISDHSEVVACLHFTNDANLDPPIPGWVSKSPRFKAHIKAFTDNSDLDALLPEHALVAIYEEYIREAGRLARNELNDKFKTSKKRLLPNVVLISRVIATDHVSLASKLIAQHVFFADRICISCGHVYLVQPLAYAEEFRSCKSASITGSLNREAAKKQPNVAKI